MAGQGMRLRAGLGVVAALLVGTITVEAEADFTVKNIRDLCSGDIPATKSSCDGYFSGVWNSLLLLDAYAQKYNGSRALFCGPTQPRTLDDFVTLLKAEVVSPKQGQALSRRCSNGLGCYQCASAGDALYSLTAQRRP